MSFLDRFWRWYDRAARVDFFGTLFGFVFDWKLGLPVMGAAMIATLSAIAEGKSLFDVVVTAAIFAASVGVVTIAVLLVMQAIRGPDCPGCPRRRAGGGKSAA